VCVFLRFGLHLLLGRLDFGRLARYAALRLSSRHHDILHGITTWHFTALRHGTSRRENTLSPSWAFVGGRDAYFMAQRDGIWVFGLAFCTIYMHTDYDDMEVTTDALGVGFAFVDFCVGSGRCGT
jgi:hypothetical protein